MSSKKPDFIARVSSNLKSRDGAPWSVDLHSKTLIVGPNGSRKTAVVQALELAVGAFSSDVNGKLSPVKAGATLFGMVPGQEVHATAMTDEGHTYTYDRRIDGTTIKNAQHSGPGVQVFPLHTIREALQAGPDKAKKMLLKLVVGEATEADVLAFVPADVHERYRTVAKGQSGNELDTLLFVEKYASDKKRAFSKESREAEVRHDRLASQLSARPTERHIEQLSEEIEQLRQELTGVPSAARVELLGEFSGAQVQNAEANLEAWRAREKEERQGKMGDLDKQFVFATSAVDALEYAVEKEWDQCPLCSYGGKGNGQMKGHLSRCLEFQLGRQETLDKEIMQVEASLESTAAVQQWRGHLDELKSQAAPSSGVNPATVDALVDKVGALVRSQHLCTQWDEVNRALAQSRTAAARSQEYKQLESACAAAIHALMARGMKDYLDRTNRYLPLDWAVDIVLEDNKRAAFRVGIVRNGVVHAGLSGGEWSAVTAALAMAAADPTKLTVIVPEDRAWDAARLRKVMVRFGRFPGQVIMTSTVRFKGRCPKNWEVIDSKGQEFLVPDVPDDDDGGLEDVIEPEVVEPEVVEPKPGWAPNDSPGWNAPSSDLTPEPPPQGPHPSAVLQMRSLGFSDEQIQRASVATVGALIRRGLMSTQVDITPDGGWLELVS